VLVDRATLEAASTPRELSVKATTSATREASGGFNPAKVYLEQFRERWWWGLYLWGVGCDAVRL